MTSLFELREKIKNFYGEHEIVLRSIMKFLAAFISFVLIKSNIGYMSVLNAWWIILVMAGICAFLPLSAVNIILAADIVVNIFSVSVELGSVILLVMLIMFLLFFRFSPKQGVLLVLVPLAFFLKIPYAVPIIAGLIWAPYACVPVIFGTIIYFMINIVSKNTMVAEQISGGKISSAGFDSITNLISNDSRMILVILAFVLTILVVYFIKRMSVDNAWTIAIFTGGILEFVVIMVGILILKTEGSLLEIIIGSILSIMIAFIVQFFVFSVDYSRTEHTQFEDDEYYYYVKAVPKINVTAPEMNVKRINAQRRKKNQGKKLK